GGVLDGDDGLEVLVDDVVEHAERVVVADGDPAFLDVDIAVVVGRGAGQDELAGVDLLQGGVQEGGDQGGAADAAGDGQAVVVGEVSRPVGGVGVGIDADGGGGARQGDRAGVGVDATGTVQGADAVAAGPGDVEGV